MIESKSFLNTLLVTLFIYMPLFWQPVQAQTPDGETPANEGVCDVLIGGTPGLYGLCVAFCEAQDLDEYGKTKPANNKLLTVYRKKMKATDSDMPCVVVEEPCPCWTSQELVDMSAIPGAQCGSFNGATYILAGGGVAEVFPFQDRGICSYGLDGVNRRYNMNGSEFTDQQWQGCVSEMAAVCP